MRLILVLLLYLILSILSIPLLIVEIILRKVAPSASLNFAMFMVTISFNAVLFLSGCKREIIGLENIPKDQPVLFAANHRSFYDIIATYPLFISAGHKPAYISKKEIQKFPVIGQWMYFLNCLFIDRDDIKQSLGVIINAIALIKGGQSVYIAPEGTRNTEDTLLPFKEGSMKIAIKSGAPIVPVCIKDTEKIFEDHFPMIKAHKVSIIIGEPIYPDKLEPSERKKVGAMTRLKVQEMYDQSGK
ncbi:MAG: 1-acyl-sn-glycerol-3-phosphate acyltransferase [Eubacterium sp.]|nr:1-acyl-sn-glycerol-3-phosphate acyltransferase [Eubacterium sp.]